MKLILIDANSLIYRTYHALPKLVDAQNRPVQAVYGLANILLKFLNQYKADFIFAIYDRPEPTIRHQVFKEYKATRPPTTDDLKLQISLSKKIFNAFKIPVLEKVNYEADDLIATLKGKFFQKVDEIIILSGDLDTLQLVDQKTKVLTMQKGISQTKIYSIEEIKKKYNLNPKQLIDYKSLIGDPSDNIVGVLGIGPKTAEKLLNQYDNVEKIIEMAQRGELESKLNEKILEKKEQILFNKDLITLKDNIDIDESLLAPYQGFKIEDLVDCFEEFGFKSLINRIKNFVQGNNLENDNNSSHLLISSTSRGNEIIGKDSLNQIKSPFFFFIDGDFIKIIDSDEKIKILEKQFLKDLLILNNQKFTFDLKKILKEILQEDFYFDKKINLKKIYDLKLIFLLLNPEKTNLTLESFIYLHQNKDNDFSSSLILILKVADNLIKKLQELQLEQIYFDFELPLSPILARMEIRGIKLDISSLEIFQRKIQEKISQILSEIYEIANFKFNLNSPRELRNVLFKKLRISSKGLAKTSKGEISTQEQELKKISHLHPIIQKILEYRKLSKFLSTYAQNLLRNYNSSTNRVHPTFNQMGTVTGRIISENPNLQNIPLEGILSQSLRKIFVCDKDYIFVSADYSQIELRLLAHLSKDENLINAFKNNLDIHSQTAKLVFGDDSAENRRKAKIINFSIVYGVTSKSLAEKLSIPVSEANKLIEKFFYFYPGVKKFKEEMIDFAKVYGYSQTILGRKRFIPEINYQSYREKLAAERIAVNTPIQSLAAEILKKVIIDIDDEIYKRNLPAYLVLTIHDEIIYEVKIEFKEELKIIIKEKMENVLSLTVPLVVNIKEGFDLNKE